MLAQYYADIFSGSNDMMKLWSVTYGQKGQTDVNVEILIQIILTVIGSSSKAWRIKFETTRPSFICILGP